ncbi:Glucose-repressible alcohol dehydrogenase transcriptional effector [Cladochytrium tenue]|nr:Glucose-repressible alcohol dehydrogenase transcriptional effector [Cladochytrium tenue]
MDSSSYGSLPRHYQKAMEALQLSRSSASPHHHARIAAAAARTAMVGGASVGGSAAGINSAINGASNEMLAYGANRSQSVNQQKSGNDRPSQWTALDLGGMQIKNVSDSLFQYTFLTTLYLNHNNLNYLPASISRLRSLTCLDVSGNKLTAVPPELGLVVSLRELLLFDNQLTFLPVQLGSLFQLELLGIEGNPLPETIVSVNMKDGASGVIMLLRENITASKYASDPYSTALSIFTLLQNDVIEFQQLAIHRPDVRKTEDIFNRVMIKDNIAVIAVLESKQNPANKILVANAHLHWDPAYSDVKLMQTAMLVEEIQRISSSFAAKSNDSTALPVLICGDFNSLPSSGVYELLSRGSVAQDHQDFGTHSYGSYTAEGLSHRLSLKSACSVNGVELDFTNFTPSFRGAIEYIWYSTLTLGIAAFLGNLDREYVAKSVGLPDPHHPSDHIPLLVACRWREDKNRKRAK